MANKTFQEKKEFDELPEIELSKKISKDMTIINSKINANKEEEQVIKEKQEKDIRREILKRIGGVAKWLNKNVGVIDWEIIAYCMSFMGGMKVLTITIVITIIQSFYKSYMYQYLNLWGENYQESTKYGDLLKYTAISMIQPIFDRFIWEYKDKRY